MSQATRHGLIEEYWDPATDRNRGREILEILDASHIYRPPPTHTIDLTEDEMDMAVIRCVCQPYREPVTMPAYDSLIDGVARAIERFRRNV